MHMVSWNIRGLSTHLCQRLQRVDDCLAVVDRDMVWNSLCLQEFTAIQDLHIQASTEQHRATLTSHLKGQRRRVVVHWEFLGTVYGFREGLRCMSVAVDGESRRFL